MAKNKISIDPHIQKAADNLTPIIGFMLGMQQNARPTNPLFEIFLSNTIRDLQKAKDYLYEAARREA